MEARVSVTEGGDELSSLLDWLRQEDELRGRVRPLSVTPELGHMGGAGDALTVALGGGGAITVLVASISVWLRNRRSDVNVEVTIGDRKVSLDVKRFKADPAGVRELVEAASQALAQD
ncbi:effector-associated constant component EACC1 [Amycolatopsis sp. H20-H5]|uniref:effector-associated constant component EACC1 n=1 Tax=Amycolatopsis sp. H20-H5 TaxID=3046309 RepID=UPI002DBE8472|nr:hypothetical protein [Amycolatopsis sp. H20-H5]MEC3981626.1 hypothetical protein [Amycolatopsis sp. H20-H5]